MSRFSVNQKIYVQAKIVEIDPNRPTKYRVTTSLGNLYVTEEDDHLSGNPYDVYTAREAYALFIEIANMTPEDINLCFGEDFNNVSSVLTAGMDLDEIRQKVIDWEVTNELSVGDMVRFTSSSKTGSEEPIICAIIGKVKSTDNPEDDSYKFMLYDDKNNKFYEAERSEITNANYRSNAVKSLIDDLDKYAEEAREEIEDTDDTY